jgi:uncharacterized protein (TIGR03382 family)
VKRSAGAFLPAGVALLAFGAAAQPAPKPRVIITGGGDVTQKGCGCGSTTGALHLLALLAFLARRRRATDVRAR